MELAEIDTRACHNDEDTAECSARIEFLPSKIDGVHENIDPCAEGAKIVQGWQGSIRTLIEACIATNDTLGKIEKDRAAADQFIGVLVDGKILSKAEARLGAASPKLSKLRAIGENSSLLLSQDILPRLPAGYSPAYQVVALYKLLNGDEAGRRAKLIEIMDGCDGELSREYLSKATKRAKKSNGDRADLSASDAAESQGASPPSGSDFSLIVLTPAKQDLRLIGEDYSEREVLARCLRVHELVAEEAVAVVAAPVRALPLVVSKLLPLCGFDRISHVLLTKAPSEADVIGSDVIIVAERGRQRLASVPKDLWSRECGHDILSVAAAMMPESKKRLHVFATSPNEGWDSIVGDANWAEEPSV